MAGARRHPEGTTMRVTTRGIVGILLGAIALPACGAAVAAADSAPALKTEAFDRDPGWDGLNNRVPPKDPKAVHQDFGYSEATHFAGKEAGEIGGTIWRGGRAASYADEIPART